MERTLLTYDQCREIVERNDEMKFYETKHIVDGYDVSIFNYKLAWYGDFKYEEIEITEGDKKVILNGNTIIGGRKISDISDEELSNLGFEFLSKFES